MSNELAQAQSAYLKSHSDNPVDWRVWSGEAFEEARRRDVPVFISIGYAACHWCHVMARESFEDTEVAAVLNEHFVSIKVDREEHPDVDETYMAATQAMTGRGGWPMSVFTLPDGRVFHAGTYFPPQRRGQVPSFSELLQAVLSAWTQRRAEVEESAAQIAASLGEQRRQQAEIATVVSPGAEGQETPFSPRAFSEVVSLALSALEDQEDAVHGGFGAAPKFPPSPLLGFLLEESAHHPNSPAAGLAMRTMEAMGRSALFDQVEGGFARYATDRAWALPHFEKMLYDNAQLIGSYATLSAHPAARDEQREDAERIARMSIGWLKHRLLLGSGLLASSLDADTVDENGEHHEGGTYIFSDAELTEAAQQAGLSPEQAEQLVRLNRGVPADEHAVASGAPLNITEHTPRTLHFDSPLTGEQRGLWEKALPELRRRRSARPQPARDEKVIASWNAQAVSSLAQAAALWHDDELLELAAVLGRKMWDIHVESDPHSGEAMVYRTSYDGVRGDRLGTLGDHAQVANACFALASAGGGEAQSVSAEEWNRRGCRVLGFILRRFLVREEQGSSIGERSANGWSLIESLDDDGLLARAQHGPAHTSPFDGPEPSSLAALLQALQTAEALGMAAELTSTEQEVRVEAMLHHVPFAGPQAPQLVGASMVAAGRVSRQSPAFRIIAGEPRDVAAVRRTGALYGIPVEPLAEDAVGEDRTLQLSVCLGGAEAMVCLPPVSSIGEALKSVGSAQEG